MRDKLRSGCHVPVDPLARHLTDYKVILATFRSAFPYVAVYYSGGYKTIGHTVLLGSKSPTQSGLQDGESAACGQPGARRPGRVNVAAVYDLLNGFGCRPGRDRRIQAGVPLNTDDRPCIIFSKFRLLDRPFMGLSRSCKYRITSFPTCTTWTAIRRAAIKETIDSNFEAVGYTRRPNPGIQGIQRGQSQNFNQPREVIVQNLLESKAIFEQVTGITPPRCASTAPTATRATFSTARRRARLPQLVAPRGRKRARPPCLSAAAGGPRP